MNNNWKLYVPTYMRKSPRILEMLKKDKNLEMTFFVRKDLFENGYYNELKNIDRLEFVLLENVHDLGDTREQMMIHAKKNNIKYVVMFDDCIDSLIDVNDLSKPISNCINECVNRLMTDKLKEFCIMFEFYRKSRHYSNMPLSSKYFLENPIQAFIVNVDLAFKEKINFHTKEIVGVEDEAFFAETLQHGLITCSNSDFIIDGELPGVKKEGGDHHNNDFSQEDKLYDKLEKLRREYNGNMYGVYQTKRYRKTIGHCIACTQFDLNYFYRTLVEKRKENEDVIKTKFLI